MWLLLFIFYRYKRPNAIFPPRAFLLRNRHPLRRQGWLWSAHAPVLLVLLVLVLLGRLTKDFRAHCDFVRSSFCLESGCILFTYFTLFKNKQTKQTINTSKVHHSVIHSSTVRMSHTPMDPLYYPQFTLSIVCYTSCCTYMMYDQCSIPHEVKQTNKQTTTSCNEETRNAIQQMPNWSSLWFNESLIINRLSNHWAFITADTPGGRWGTP